VSSFPAENAQSDNRKYPSRPILGVGGIVIREGCVLLVRRGKPPLEGAWSIPGGMLEIGETAHEAVARELAEETGIEARVLELVEIFENVALDESGRVQYHFVILDYLCEYAGGTAEAGSDASEAAWVKESDLCGYPLTPGALPVIQKAFRMTHES
jgi:8-oxo-dGTP diphosphatase